MMSIANEENHWNYMANLGHKVKTALDESRMLIPGGLDPDVFPRPLVWVCGGSSRALIHAA